MCKAAQRKEAWREGERGGRDGTTHHPGLTLFDTPLPLPQDTNPNKINLGVGAYRTDDGKVTHTVV